MGSVSRGFRLAKASWTVVKQDRELLVLPVISFFCSLIVMVVFGLGMWGVGLPEQNQSPSPGIYVLGFVMYVALAFVTIFFNAAVIGTAMKRLQGEDAKISDGLALARQHIGKIFVWALITATVGMILRTIQERSGILGRILLGIVGIAWTVLTYFVIPVLLFEPVGVGESIKRSTQIFRERWGEQFIGQATIGLAFFLLTIPIALIGGAIAVAVPILGVPLLIVAIGGLMAVAAACSGVFNAALYRYATTGEASGAFSLEDMNSSFRPRKGGSGVGPAGFTGGGFGGGQGDSQTMPPAPEGSPDRPDL
jgi:Family of unknown function (DUF6159)